MPKNGKVLVSLPIGEIKFKKKISTVENSKKGTMVIFELSQRKTKCLQMHHTHSCTLKVLKEKTTMNNCIGMKLYYVKSS